MLLGRTEERLALDHLLGQAREGYSGVLAVVGEPGIGKSALLDYAAQAAGGMRVLRARGIESEAEVPFAGLAELLRPVLGVMEQIPAPQAQALAGALALGPSTARDRFAIGAATLSLLSACAEEAPLTVLIDDAHLLDGSSAGALLFAARRLIADPIAVVLAVRDGEPSLLDGADLRVLRVGGLSQSAGVELLASAHVSPEAAEQLHRATGGNPLALLELAPDAAAVASQPYGPIPISTSIADAFLRRFGQLPETTRRLLVLAAASDGGDCALLARAGGPLGLEIGELAAAEEAGLVNIDGARVEFRHPLARSAVYAQASAAERRDVHAALASALPDRDLDRRAWHLAAAAIGPDDAAASALEQAGARALDRSAYSVAAAAFERGAGLQPAESERAELLFRAADAASLAGEWQRTLALIESARLHAGDPVLIARIDQVWSLVALRQGPIIEGCRLLVDAAERVAQTDPELAVVMLAQSVLGGFYAGATSAMVSAAERAAALAERAGSRRALLLAAVAAGQALVADGQGEAGAAAVRRAIALFEGFDELFDEPLLVVSATVGALYLREAQIGRDLIERAFESTRRQAAVGTLPQLLHLVARDQATTDQWKAAEGSYDEAIRLARETGQQVELAAALAGVAWLEAREGREAACRVHVAEALALSEQLGVALFSIWGVQALGDLELGLGRPMASVVHHEAHVAALRTHEIADVDMSPAPELVEAYLRLDRRGDAEAIAAGYEIAADAKGQPWARARALRCRGLLAGDDPFEPYFEEALALHALTPDVFELARTRFVYGARLRRHRERIRAREQLRAALEVFERLGSKPWADQATVELEATGETARRRDASTLDELTPQERQIARLLAEGKTTREAAAAVFLSPKTVEYHLSHVYRKLGIRSRQELREALLT